MKKIFLILLTITAIITACAGPKNISEEQKLRLELKKWESFDSQGVVELSYKGLAIRKMFIASKNGNELRFDIIDGGLMGSKAEPLMSVYVADYVSIRSPFIPMLESLDISQAIPMESLTLSTNVDSLVTHYAQKIIKDKKIELNGVVISFSKNYLLDTVLDSKSNTKIKALYTGNSKLSELYITSNDDISIRLSFDKIEYIQPHIVPLPKAEPSSLENIIQDLNKISIDSLLRDYLQYRKEK
jgi:hypothetical protein